MKVRAVVPVAYSRLVQAEDAAVLQEEIIAVAKASMERTAAKEGRKLIGPITSTQVQEMDGYRSLEFESETEES